MNDENIARLAVLMEENRDVLLSCWLEKDKQLLLPRKFELPILTDHFPDLINELIVALKTASNQSFPEPQLSDNSLAHGRQRYQNGFDIVQVVAEYSTLRGCIFEFAENRGIRVEKIIIDIINKLLDRAIAGAVLAFVTEQKIEIERRRNEYLTFLAHDFRSPLSVVSLSVILLEQDFLVRSLSQDQRANTMKMLRNNLQHIETLINNVLKENTQILLEYGVQLQRTQFFLWPFVEAVILNLQPLAKNSDVRFVNQVPEDIEIYADAALLNRVFQNLIANAIKHTPHGDIHINAKKIQPVGTIECSVIDNGEGIPPDHLETVFDKFESDSDSEDISGLGLTIVKTFIKAHGGQITVESEQGVGSMFRFTLPGSVYTNKSGSL